MPLRLCATWIKTRAKHATIFTAFSINIASACGIAVAIGLIAQMTDWVWLAAVLGAVVILAPAALYLVFSGE